MTFNSESESMTIKRLEIALRKMDLQLLKTAGYKLHEKFHSGHKFHYISELRQILNFVEAENLDHEISQLISSTIKEILQKSDGASLKNIPSSLENNDSSPNDILQSEPVESCLDSAYSNEIPSEIAPTQSSAIDELIPSPISAATVFSAPQGQYSSASYPAGANLENIFIYYEEKNSEIDSKLVTDYKNIIASNANINETFGVLKRILNIINSDLSSLNKIFSTLSTLKNKINLAAASMNSNLLGILDENSIKFKIPSVYENYASGCWKFLPIFGNTAIFECSDCGFRFLNRNFEQKCLALQCEKCSEAAFPKLALSSSSDGFIVQNTFDALLNSKIWVLINPPYGSNSGENLQIQNLLNLAYKNSTPKRIYILTQDAERKEFYRQMFLKINENCEIKSNYLNDESFCEDFVKNETMSRIYN